MSIKDRSKYPRLPVSRHLTDYYLLALAIEHKAKLATLDRRIDPRPIKGGNAALVVI